MSRFLLDNIKKIRAKHVIGGFFAVALPAVFFYLLEFYTHNPFLEVRPWAQFFNVVLFELIAALLFFVVGDLKWAYRIEAVLAMLFGIANAYVVRFRTNPIVPWDIFSWRTAASVADNYDFTPDGRMITVTLLFVVVIILLRFVDIKAGKFVCVKRWLLGTMPLCILLAFSSVLQQENFQNRYRLYNKLFTPVYMTDVDGIPVTFVMNLAYMSIEKPDGYRASDVQEILASYEQGLAQEDMDENAGESEASELPNIIVVMNEAFSDLSVLGNFETNQDYMPYLHSLQEGNENTVTGMLHVSVCGGNTANTEFEFLTGNTMAFLPQGSIPYQQYITGERESLASHLKNLGYQTVATHPYNATGWERNTVYPWLGFDDSIFVDEYVGASRVRQYVSDAACVEKIISVYEQKEADTPLFLFNVTMQNHGGYQDSYPNFTEDVTVEGIDNFSVNQYLSLVKLSDEALELLISYFSDVDEKTVVVFFGDHQPSDTVAAPILAENGMAWNALSEEQLKLRYQVPYVIWANYDIAEEQNVDTSVNYLGAEVLERVGVPTTAYQAFLLELKEEYPVISTVNVERRGEATGAGEALEKKSTELEIYRQLQYYQLFDWKEEP